MKFFAAVSKACGLVQGPLTGGEGSVQLASLLRWLGFKNEFFQYQE